MGSERAGSNTRRNTLLLLGLPLILLIAAPLVGLLTHTDSSALWTAAGSPAVLQALGVTCVTTSMVVGVTLLCGTPLAILLSTRAQAMHGIRSIIELPTVLPPAVAGIALLTLFGRMSTVGQFLAGYSIFIPFSTAAVVLAQLFVAAPLYIRACMIAFDRVDPLLADAALIDGATPWQYWTRVVFPLSRSGIQAGIGMTTARALGEFGATALFAGNMPGRTRTMALAIYVSADSEPAVASAMSIILLVVALCILIVTNLQPAPEA